MLNLNHKRLDVYNVSIDFVYDIYQLTEKFPNREIYLLTNQLKRASVSVSSNIAEGSSRISPKERKRFYEISRSSLVEIDTQIEISKRLNYIKNDESAEVENKISRLFSMLSKLISNTC